MTATGGSLMMVLIPVNLQVAPGWFVVPSGAVDGYR